MAKVVERYPKLQILLLSDNTINDVNELKSLAKLEELMQLELNNTSVSKKDGYREKVFALIPSLEVIFISLFLFFKHIICYPIFPLLKTLFLYSTPLDR